MSCNCLFTSLGLDELGSSVMLGNSADIISRNETVKIPYSYLPNTLLFYLYNKGIINLKC